MQNTTLKNHLENPLFAERYADEVVDMLVELKITDDPLLNNGTKASTVDKERTYWLGVAKEANQKQREGLSGYFQPMKEYGKGDTLLVDGAVYFDTQFEVAPGPELHVFLSTVIDPRDVTFPDATAIDLGTLKTPYGAQSYVVENFDSSIHYKTVTIWDTKLDRLFTFAQIKPLY